MAAARNTVRVSSATSSWVRTDASFARTSARSLQGRTTCDGAHCRMTRHRHSTSCGRAFHTSAYRWVGCSASPPLSVTSAAWESVQQTMGSPSWAGFSTMWMTATLRATNYALKLEQVAPASVGSSRHPVWTECFLGLESADLSLQLCLVGRGAGSTPGDVTLLAVQYCRGC